MNDNPNRYRAIKDALHQVYPPRGSADPCRPSCKERRSGFNRKHQDHRCDERPVILARVG